MSQGKKPNILFRLCALGVTAALMLGALALVVYRDRLNLDNLRRWLTYRALETSETGESPAFSHTGGDKLSVAYLSSGMVTVSATGARYYSLTGEKYGEEVCPMDNPVLTRARGSAVAYDVGGSSLFLFQGGQLIRDLELDSGADLLSARVNDSGWLAVTAQQSGFKGAVTVYDGQQKPVIQIKLSSTFVVDAVLSPDCRTVAVVTMGQQGGVFYSRLLFYPVDREEPSLQVDLGATTVLDLDYEHGQVWVVGEDGLYIVPEDGSEPRVFSYGRSYLKGSCLTGDGFALLLTSRYRTVGATHAVLVNDQAQLTHTLELSGQVLDFDCAGGYCALLTAGKLTIYNRELEQYAALDGIQNTRYVSMASDGSALLSDGQQARLFIPS